MDSFPTIVESRKRRRLGVLYEEAISGNWSTRQLERQINSFHLQKIKTRKAKAPMMIRSERWPVKALECKLRGYLASPSSASLRLT